MASLKEFKCVPCKGGEPQVSAAEIDAYRKEIPDWDVTEVNGEKRLVRTFKFKDFAQALDFTDRVGRAAEEEDHHPEIVTEWGKVKVSWWTHKIGGLHKNDFIMAARTDALYHP